jgi:hypothetical protein
MIATRGAGHRRHKGVAGWYAGYGAVPLLDNATMSSQYRAFCINGGADPWSAADAPSACLVIAAALKASGGKR